MTFYFFFFFWIGIRNGLGEPIPSLPRGKNPGIDNLSIFRFWLQILFQKYHINPYNTQFLINKHKIGAGFSLHSIQWGQWGGQSSLSIRNLFKVRIPGSNWISGSARSPLQMIKKLIFGG